MIIYYKMSGGSTKRRCNRRKGNRSKRNRGGSFTRYAVPAALFAMNSMYKPRHVSHKHRHSHRR